VGELEGFQIGVFEAASRGGTGPAVMPAVGDDALIAAVRAGDEAALLGLYDRYHPILMSLALRILGERETAEEVLQDAFLRVWRGSAMYDGKRGTVLAWLFGIVRNRCIDEMRSHRQKARLREATELTERMARPDDKDLAEEAVVRLAVREAVAALPVHQRAPVELVYFGGLTHREAALALGEPLGTTKSRIRAAMDQLRTSLIRGVRA
jgi:RNA polymerase sigma-70 factor (ECF subfamily)